MDPQRAYLPSALERGRAWGFAVNLYALRSKRNWGIGDFTDLRDFVRLAARAGAGIVGTNPLHALHYVEPEAASPYSPTSRYFRNPLYVDVEAVPEFDAAAPRAAKLRERVASPEFAATLAALREAPEIAYARVARAKWSALEELYAVLRECGGERAAAFRRFGEQGGVRLERFAVHEALSERFAREEGRAHGWPSWPEGFRQAESPEVAQWAARERHRVDYFKYLQWIADEQLAIAVREANAMPIGLYLDLAVGVDINSADVWSNPRDYVLDATIGAPPDILGPQGQNWRLRPPAPAVLEQTGGAPFGELLEANMQHAGALRLDHAMALMRLFCIPNGKAAAEGAYVAYPLETLVSVVCVESARARCLLVGEDLGNVPPGFRERMERANIFSYRVLLFERDEAGAFRPPQSYPELALATATTHDLPTLAGWAVGRDLDARERIGILPGDAVGAARSERRVDVSRLFDALRAAGELDDATFEALHRAVDALWTDAAAYDPLVRAAYRYLARSPARLVLVQLDDGLVEFEQVNLPGTFSEYPNWRRKNSLDLDEIAREGRLAVLSAEVDSRIRKGAAE